MTELKTSNDNRQLPEALLALVRALARKAEAEDYARDTAKKHNKEARAA